MNGCPSWASSFKKLGMSQFMKISRRTPSEHWLSSVWIWLLIYDHFNITQWRGHWHCWRQTVKKEVYMHCHVLSIPLDLKLEFFCDISSTSYHSRQISLLWVMSYSMQQNTDAPIPLPVSVPDMIHHFNTCRHTPPDPANCYSITAFHSNQKFDKVSSWEEF